MSNNSITISLKQLRTDFPRVIEAVEKGNHFTVIKRSKPVFEITPPKQREWDFDFTKNGYPDGIPVEELIEKIDKILAEK